MIHTLFLPTDLDLDAFKDETGRFSVCWKKEVGQALGELRNEEGKVLARLTFFEDGKFLLAPLGGYEQESKEFLASPMFFSLAKGTLTKYAEKQLRVLRRISFSFESEEALHDYRISLRKTRTVFDSFSLGLSKKQRGFWKTTFKHLGLLTSSVRDLDVLFAQLKKDEVEPQVLAVVLHEREESLASFASYVQAPSYTLLLDQWEAVLCSSFPFCTSLTIKDAVKEQQKRLHQAIDVADRSEKECSLHQVRKEGKKLRYLMDLAKLDSSFILDEVHELLGTYHDFGLLQQWLFCFLEQYKKEISSSLRTHLLQLVVAYEGKRASLLDQYKSLVIPLMEV